MSAGRPGVARRRGWLAVITIAAGLLSCVAGLVWDRLLPPRVAGRRGAVHGRMWIRWCGRRRRVVLRPEAATHHPPVLLAVALTCCLLPAGWFWTFAVSHAPEGGECTGWRARLLHRATRTRPGGGRWKFDHVLCAEHRTQLAGRPSRSGRPWMACSPTPRPATTAEPEDT